MPSLALAKKLLFGAAFFLALSASATHTHQYPDEAKSTQTTVTVHILWMPSWAAVTHFCSWIAGEAVPTDGIILGCYVPSKSTIIAVEPKNFNDHRLLEVLGHEFWHALGAKHPAN